MHADRRGALVAVLVAGILAVVGSSALGQDEAGRPRPDVSDGRTIFQRDCATCHGPDGSGTANGPSIRDDGGAGVHFYVSTGRMPLAEPEDPIHRRTPRYTREEIDALVAYAEVLLPGPAAVEVETDPLLLAKGGTQWRLNCAACHQFAGVGGALMGDQHAPNIAHATPEEVVEALRIGPGTMPQWRPAEITEEEAQAIATYVELVLQETADPGGLALGHFGPTAEGAVAWILGIGLLLTIARWIGEQT